MSARRSYLKTGDSGTRRERRRARRGTRGQREEICHHLSWVPRLMMRRLPTHLQQGGEVGGGGPSQQGAGQLGGGAFSHDQVVGGGNLEDGLHCKYNDEGEELLIPRASPRIFSL